MQMLSRTIGCRRLEDLLPWRPRAALAEALRHRDRLRRGTL